MDVEHLGKLQGLPEQLASSRSKTFQTAMVLEAIPQISM